jgi:hypothetical protein
MTRIARTRRSRYIIYADAVGTSVGATASAAARRRRPSSPRSRRQWTDALLRRIRKSGASSAAASSIDCMRRQIELVAVEAHDELALMERTANGDALESRLAAIDAAPTACIAIRGEIVYNSDALHRLERRTVLYPRLMSLRALVELPDSALLACRRELEDCLHRRVRARMLARSLHCGDIDGARPLRPRLTRGCALDCGAAFPPPTASGRCRTEAHHGAGDRPGIGRRRCILRAADRGEGGAVDRDRTPHTSTGELTGALAARARTRDGERRAVAHWCHRGRCAIDLCRARQRPSQKTATPLRRTPQTPMRAAPQTPKRASR